MSNKGDLNIIQCIYFDKILGKVNLYVVFYSMNVHVYVFEVLQRQTPKYRYRLLNLSSWKY